MIFSFDAYTIHTRGCVVGSCFAYDKKVYVYPLCIKKIARLVTKIKKNCLCPVSKSQLKHRELKCTFANFHTCWMKNGDAKVRIYVSTDA